VTDGHHWTAYRYRDDEQICVSVADTTDRSGGSTCGSSLHPFSFVTTTLWVWSTSKQARSVRLEFPAGDPVTAQVLSTGEAWPNDYAFLFFPINANPSTVVVLDANGKELRRVDCSAQGGCGPN
jgi:hypothetical protein